MRMCCPKSGRKFVFSVWSHTNKPLFARKLIVAILPFADAPPGCSPVTTTNCLFVAMSAAQKPSANPSGNVGDQILAPCALNRTARSR